MASCPLCEIPISGDRGKILEKGLKTLLVISKELDDGIADRLIHIPLPIPVYITCRRHYTKPSTVCSKRKWQDESQVSGEISQSIRRFQTQAFDIIANCLYCGRELIADLKHPG